MSAAHSDTNGGSLSRSPHGQGAEKTYAFMSRPTDAEREMRLHLRDKSLPSQVPGWHISATRSGTVSRCGRYFLKDKYQGRLSLITEDTVKRGGVHHYQCHYAEGDISPADGVGFMFGDSLPSTQNIQKVESVFVNKHGVVCSRTRCSVVREQMRLAPLEIGACVGLTIDLDKKRASFRLDLNGQTSTVDCDFSQLVGDGPVSGYFGAVVKHVDVGLELQMPAFIPEIASNGPDEYTPTMQRAPDPAGD
jgi:hypothetical protein